MDNDFLLQDRIQKIQQIVDKYGEENFYISFSGGKDSTVLHYLFDMALPENKIPRVYCDTGIDYNEIRKFVLDLQQNDERFVIIKPSVPIKQMLEDVGYPFKSKHHSQCVAVYQKHRTCENRPMLQHYLDISNDGIHWSPQRQCPKSLKYQFTEDFTLPVSDKCCNELKEKPLHRWQKENKKPFGVVGLMREEGGRRDTAVCLAFTQGKLKNFQPLVAITKDWEEWFINTYNLKLCSLYYEPYNFTRTGCKGCPFAIDLQHNLDVLQQFFPGERKQCEAIWKPVYDEYRRLGYRLQKEE